MDKQKEASKVLLTLSASRINTYQQCPRRYFYTYLKKLPRKDWDHFDLGTLAHGTLEFFHKDFKKDSDECNLKKIMKESFHKQKEIMSKEKNMAPTVLLEAYEILSEYLYTMETKGIGSNIIALEDDFNIPLEDERFSVRGYVDRLDRDEDGILHIKDYKTNKNMKYMKPFQLCVYGIYLLDKYPDVDRFRGSYVMLRHGGMLISYDFNKEDVEKEKKALIEYGRNIVEEEKWITEPSILCDWCDFKSTCLNTW